MPEKEGQNYQRWLWAGRRRGESIMDSLGEANDSYGEIRIKRTTRARNSMHSLSSRMQKVAFTERIAGSREAISLIYDFVGTGEQVEE